MPGSCVGWGESDGLGCGRTRVGKGRRQKVCQCFVKGSRAWLIWFRIAKRGQYEAHWDSTDLERVVGQTVVGDSWLVEHGDSCRTMQSSFTHIPAQKAFIQVLLRCMNVLR